MINIAIVDDELAYAEHIQKITAKYFESAGLDFKIKIYYMPNELIWDIEDNQYFDIFLIDIEMPDINGLELAHAIRQKYDEPYIIFITAFMEYCIDGYRYNAWRYIPKEKSEQMLPSAFDDLLKRIQIRIKKIYVIEMHNSATRILHDDIYYLNKDGKYTEFHTKQGIFRERKSLTKILEALDESIFIPVDRSYIINIRHVMNIKKYCLIIRNNEEIPVSIQLFQNVKSKICEYWREIS